MSSNCQVNDFLLLSHTMNDLKKSHKIRIF
nr:MAG TPA: hypothetical protein [Caudoviricetes sp.]